MTAGRQRRRRARIRALLGTGVLLLLAGAVVLVGTDGWDRARDLVAPESPAVPPQDGPENPQPSLTLITVDPTARSDDAIRVALLAQDRATGEATVLLVPTGTVVDVPGHGTFPLGEAYGFGGSELTTVTLANLLGIGIDGAAVVTVAGWAAVLDTLGPVELTVRTSLVDPQGRERVAAGTRELDGAGLADYLTLSAEGETELDALGRSQQVLTLLLDAAAADPALVERWLDLELDDGSPAIATEEPELVAEVLAALAAARGEDAVTVLTLPVTPLGAGRDGGWRVDVPRLEVLVADRLSAGGTAALVGGGRTVQILNGNGVPRIGQEVAVRLAGGGYRIVLTGNADRFTHQTTRIVLHDRSDAMVAVGRDIQRRLGVGEVELAATPGSVADVTIVVGADFPPGG